MLAVLAFAFGQPLTAQFHTLKIDGPASVAGEYNVLIGSFGKNYCETESVSGQLVLGQTAAGSTLGCDSIVTDVRGKIVMVDRGTCGFSAKALRAQRSGAIAIIICQNAANANQAIFSMAGGPEAPQITIPAFMMSLADCQKIKAALAEVGTVSISRPEVVYPEENVVWGADNGQGDFAGGLNGWTVSNLSCGGGPAGTFELWRWSGLGVVRGGCGGSQIFSRSKCNGAMVFESDFYDTNGAGCGGAATGTGPCPAGQVGELISPAIDLRGSTAAGYSLRFYQQTRQFQSTYYVGWSTDNGVTWDSVEVNSDIDVNTANTTEQALVKIPLVGVTSNTAALRVKFRYEANYYYWLIDDVQIVEQEANNLRVNPFFAVPTNAITPLSQVEPIRFLADIENVGAATQTNVELNVGIFNEDLDLVYLNTLDYGDVPANTIVENQVFEGGFTPEAEGLYLGLYEIGSDQADADSSNNAQSFLFAVSDTVFAKEFGATTTITPAASNWDAGAPHAAAYGNYFYSPNGGDYIRSISFGIANATTVAGSSLIVSVYKWLGDANGDEAADPSERELVDFNFYVVQGSEAPDELITIPFPEPGNPPVQLEANTAYLVMVEYAPPAASPTTDLVMAWSDFIDFSGMVQLYRQEEDPRFAPLVGLAGDISTEPFGTVGFAYNLVPVVRMNVGSDPTSNRQVQALRNQFVAFPNPTSGEVNLKLNLEQVSKSARVRIMDVAGRILLQQDFDNVQYDQLNFNLSNWRNGTYIVELSTEQGTGIRRVTLID